MKGIIIKMEKKKFIKNDSGFICVHCGKKVDPLGYTSRNHCPYCLWSLHVDNNPGDRSAKCGAALEPVFAEPDPKKGFIITHKCTVCGEIKRNKAADDDNRELIIKMKVNKNF